MTDYTAETALGAFEAAPGHRYTIAATTDGARVRVRSAPAHGGDGPLALELLLDGDGYVIDSRWHGPLLGASMDEHGAVLDPAMQILAGHLQTTSRS